MIDEIKSEINKENPNWLTISRLAMSIYNNSLESNFFKFKKGKINIIRSSEYKIADILKSLKESISGEFEWILVGGWSRESLTVTSYNKILDSLNEKSNTKFVVVITCKDQVIANTLKKGYLVNSYVVNVRNSYSTDRLEKIVIKGEDGFDFSSNIKDIKSNIRDLKINDILR